MKILLIGGTGTISADIAKLLADQGHDLYLLNRGTKGELTPKNAIFFKADINDDEAVQRLCSGLFFDCVVNFVAFEPEDVERDFRLFHGKTAQYIYISSASAYQKPLNNYMITESTPLSNPFWDYSRKKIVCEDSLMWHYRESSFPITIVRPSHTYSERKVPVALHGKNGSWQVLQRMLKGKPVIIHGDGTSLWTLTHSRDFARAFVGLIGNIHAIGESVHITSDETVTWNNVYSSYAELLGVQLKPLYVPSLFLAETGNAAGYDFEGELLGDKANSVVFDNSKIKRLVPGFNARIRFDQGARASMKYILDHVEEQQADPEFDDYCDNIAAVMQGAISSFVANLGENTDVNMDEKLDMLG